ncbi:MAG TPA: TlpA disulfide reductase family protein, partial [Pyrinomonadaceae bacterium]|nr:TlpA disulfide reductase family protein [Pyrinomonadaceae bacterium]
MNIIKSFILAFVLTAATAYAASAQTPLVKLDGGTVDVRAQNGKVVVLAVGASWVPLSAKQAEYLNALAKRYNGRNVVFYYVVTDSTNAKSKNFASDEAVKKFVAANKIGIPVLRDPDGAAVLKTFRIDQVPSFVIIDKSGAQSGEAFGGIDPKFDITVPISKK